MGYFLVIGRGEDPCCRAVEEQLMRLGKEVIFLQEQELFPGLEIVWELADGNSRGTVGQGKQTAGFTEIDGVLARFSGFPVSAEEFRTPNGQYLSSEWHALMRGYVRALPCPVINRVRPELWYKPFLSVPDLVSLAPGLKFTLPKTLVATRFEDAKAFFYESGRRITYSPITMPSPYAVNTDEDLQKLEKLSGSLPLYLSEVIPGETVDAYVVGADVICDGAQIPESDVREHCIEIADGLGLSFCHFHLVRSNGGEWYCLGLACMPDLFRCGDETRKILAGRLVDLMVTGDRAPV
jgi:hypothetical protein